MMPVRTSSSVNSRNTRLHLQTLGEYRRWFLLFMAMMLVGWESLAAANYANARSNSLEEGECLAILRETASAIGAQGEEEVAAENWIPQINNFTCSLDVSKTVDTRGPVMGDGYFYYEDTGIHIIYNDTIRIQYSVGGPENSFTRQSTTFHGFPAVYTKPVDCGVSGCMESFEWLVPDLRMQFSIMRINYEIPEGETQSRGIPFDIYAMAEVFYRIAYEHMPDADLPKPASGTTSGPDTTSGGEPDSAGTESQNTDGASGDLFGVPLGIFLLSVGLPVAGSLAGAGLSAIISAISNTASAGNVVYQRAVFTERFDQIIKQKIKEGYYIKNPNFVKNPDSPEFLPVIKQAKDAVVSYVSGSPDLGGRCGEAVKWGKQWLEEPAKEIFGSGTVVSNIDIVRQGYFENWDINHTSTKLILPNGERLVPDVHESMVAGKAVVYNEADWVKKYANIIGGKVTVEYPSTEDEVINILEGVGKDTGAAHIKRSNSYSKNPAYFDLLIKSYTENPAVKPPAPHKPTPAPPPDLAGLEGKPGSRR